MAASKLQSAKKDKKAKAPKPEAILKFYRETLKAQQKTLKDYKNNKNLYRKGIDADSNDSLDLEGNLMRRQLLQH